MTTPSSDPQQPDAGADKPNRLPLIVGLLLVLAIGLGVAGYFIGKSAADDSQAKRDGAAEARADYEPGQPGYESIYRKGKKAGKKEGLAEGNQQGQQTGETQGKKVGLEEGQQQGEAQGDATGVKNGANAALGGFTDWDTNALYVVTMTQGTGNVPFAVKNRQPMQSGVGYRLCSDNPQELCQITLPSG